MHLKSLTLKGFKSFASTTTLEFEPGITCVVGPNGSGKSNVVDAVAWVMGEQGAKSLRGGSMQDVIFAGTSGRAPLGRAEVALTIDNTDGALPIEYTEVTISRTMFRNGGSEYAINGQACRLLDIQELLSDSGIGREMHVIVGQGQLDQVLHASPEDRRGFIEEAAGVLKHRRRKEKALRKLEAMEGNLTRLNDLTGELRRQLKPLGRQAEVARRAVVIQADVRDARLRLLADDLVQMQSTLQQEVADETALRERRARVEADLSTATARETQLDVDLRAAAPILARAQQTHLRLAALRERVLGLVSLAQERARLLTPDADEQTVGPDPDDLVAQARSVRAHEAELSTQLTQERAVLSAAQQQRVHAETVVSDLDDQVRRASRAAADRREGLARLAGQVAAARSRSEARQTEIQRLETQRADALARAATAHQAFTAIETQVAGLDEGEAGLDQVHERALSAAAAAQTHVLDLTRAEQEADRVRAALSARVEALESALSRKDGAAALVESGLADILGALATQVQVRAGYEHAVAAALGPAADALAVGALDTAVSAIARLRADDAGHAALLVADATAAVVPPAPTGATSLLDVISAQSGVHNALTHLLARVLVVDDLREAQRIVRSDAAWTVVTREGDVVTAALVRGGSAGEASRLEVQAALDEARADLQRAIAECERIRFALVSAEEAQRHADADVEAALAALHESDARMAAVAEQLGTHASAMRAATAEAERLADAIAAAEQARDADLATVAQVQERLSAAEAEPEQTEPDAAAREQANVALEQAREAETQALLAVRTSEERVRAAATRADQLEKAAATERAARERAIARRVERERAGRAAVAVGAVAAVLLDRIERSLAAAERERDEVARSRAAYEGEMLELRAAMRELSAELERLTDSVHRDEVARAEQRLRIETLETKALEEFGVDAETLIAEYGPDVLVVPSPPAPGDEVDESNLPQPYPYVREEQEKRLKEAEKGLALLGRVNPLALEEFQAMEDRHRFLTEQLEDLKRSRNDLLSIIREVDERVQQVFSAAFADVEAQFETVFSRLFPGGEGRLVLTDPDNLLTTGIEIEARPPGKKVKRLQLLSGGERSLTAVAFLVALFMARPSPFYVLDEVEAALDDTNLGRLIEVLAELRANSQLLIVTHQKRTMEIADALYGISMRGDGVSSVISQRLRDHDDERVPAHA